MDMALYNFQCEKSETQMNPFIVIRQYDLHIMATEVKHNTINFQRFKGHQPPKIAKSL